MTLFLLAIVAGVLTTLAPCILPILPVILGVGTGSKWRPIFVVLGFIGAFSVFGAAFATVGSFLGLSNETFRTVAIVLLVFFAFALIFEKIYQKLTAGISATLNRLGAKISAGSATKKSASSGILVGVSLGVIWTPCAGPILGTILTLAAAEGDFLTTSILFAAYSFGAGVPMLGIAYGSGWLFSKLKFLSERSHLLNRIFGILILITALGIAFGYDRVVQAFLVQFYPSGILPL